MKVTPFGQAPSSYSGLFFNQLFARLTLMFGQVVSHQQETPRIMLRAPGGKIYAVTVDDAGVLVVTDAATLPSEPSPAPP